MSDGLSAGISLVLPALQAAATILILEKQRDLYDDIADERKKLINDAVDRFVASVDAQLASGVFRSAYGSVPQAILYEKVNMAEEVLQAAESSIRGLPAAKRHMEAANRIMGATSATPSSSVAPSTICLRASCPWMTSSRSSRTMPRWRR